MSSPKGFATAKAPQNQPSKQDQQNAAQLQNLTQMVIQLSQGMRLLQDEVGMLTNVLRFTEANRAITENDFVVIDALGHLINEDGTTGEVQPGTAIISHVLNMKNSENYAAGFVKALAAKSAGNNYEVDCTFPEDHHSLPSKTLRFKVAVIKVLDTANSDASSVLLA